MWLSTIGHASLVISDDQQQPILLTDPWLIGSAYWRSWWIENYPSHAKIQKLTASRFCYITHEHPDHFHPPSLRLLGNMPHYLAPTLSNDKIASFLRDKGNMAKCLPPMKWYRIHTEMAILSIPLFNDDSVLLISTTSAIIVNLNDAKPSRHQLDSLKTFLQNNLRRRKLVVMSSYSPASIVNSFRKSGCSVSIKDKSGYCESINKIVSFLEADFFMPFASQVIFCRPDSEWANAYKVSFSDLKDNWGSKGTQLLPPYSTLDLSSFSFSHEDPDEYNLDRELINKKVAEQIQIERDAALSCEDQFRLLKKLKSQRSILALLFPKGIGLVSGTNEITFRPISGAMVNGVGDCNFYIHVPAYVLAEVLNNDHFGDLGTTMFTIIDLNGHLNPKMVYLFIMLLTLHDYGHTISYSRFLSWVGFVIKHLFWSIPRDDINQEIELLEIIKAR